MSYENDLEHLRAKIGMHANKFSRYDERFKFIADRFDTIDASHKDLKTTVDEIRAKIFNGYESTIQDTRSQVDRIYTLLEEISNKHEVHTSMPHIDHDAVKELVKSAISEYDSQIMRENRTTYRWSTNKSLTVIGAVVAGIIMVSTILTALHTFGVFG